MSTERRVLSEARDVTPDILQLAERTHDDWFSDTTRIDWEEFLDRMCADPDIDWDIEQMDAPAVQKIQRHVRRYAQE